MNLKVWAFSESPEVANEMATAADAIARPAGGSVTVVGLNGSGPKLAGDAKLVLKGSDALSGSPELAAGGLSREAKEANPDVILVGSTRNGKEVAARIAVKLGRPCASDVFCLSVAR